MRRLLALLLVLISLLSLTSCYGMTEVDEILYVLALGIDRGVSDKWRLTIQYNALKEEAGKGEGESGGSSSESSYATVDAPSFFAALSMLNTVIPRKISLEHTQLIIFSEEIAKDGFVGEYIGPLNRYYELRRNAHVFVCRGKAMNVIKNNNPVIGTSVSKNFLILYETAKETGLLPRVTLESFYEGLKSPSHQPIATLIAVNDSDHFEDGGKPWDTTFKQDSNYLAGEIPRKSDHKIEVCGTAVFKEDIIVEKLTGEETRYLLMGRGEFESAVITIQDPKVPQVIVPLKVNISRQPKIKVGFYNSKPVIKLQFMLDAEVLAVQSLINYEQPELIGYLEEALRITVEKGIKDLANKCKKLNVDAFEFGNYAMRNFLTIDAFEQYDWSSNFQTAEFDVDVSVYIRRTGEQIKSYTQKY